MAGFEGKLLEVNLSSGETKKTDIDKGVLRKFIGGSGLAAKLMFDRVVVLFADNAEYREIDPAMLKELTDYYQNALLTAVKSGYEIVDQPGPGVLRVRTAITGVKPSKPVANTLSTIIPVGIVASGATKAISGDNLGTREAQTEFEVVDAQSGERLAAAVDKRQGG